MCVFVPVLCVDSPAQVEIHWCNGKKSLLIGQLAATEPLMGFEVKHEASHTRVLDLLSHATKHKDCLSETKWVTLTT